MDGFTSSSGDPNSRFASQAATAEDLLKQQTVGLVNLNDFRKRRAEALERKEFEQSSTASGATTPADRASTPQPIFKKKRKTAAKGKLSFAADDDEDAESITPAAPTPRASTPADKSAVNSDAESNKPRKKLGANVSVGLQPRVMTKSALAREAQKAEFEHKAFIATREKVKATEIVIPFVFYDGTNIPGGRCRLKKGDHIWLFLDRARKAGAELGVGGDKGKREWARVSVEDLMLVRGEVILPHHYEFYYFLFNKIAGFNGPIFDYSAEPTKATPTTTETESINPADYDPLEGHGKAKERAVVLPDSELEGFHNDPAITKVVDRRWYEKNKHIFPASVWKEYNPEIDFSKGQRKDTEGNMFFFS